MGCWCCCCCCYVPMGCNSACNGKDGNKKNGKETMCVVRLVWHLFVVRSVRRVRARASFIGDRFRIERCWFLCCLMNCTSTRELNNGLYHYIRYFMKNPSRFPNCCTSVWITHGLSSWLIEYWREGKMELRKLSLAYKFFVHVKEIPLENVHTWLLNYLTIYDKTNINLWLGIPFNLFTYLVL